MTAQPIFEIAEDAGIDTSELLPYGRYVAKVPLESEPGDAPLVMVTAINPTPLGEGNTTTAIGLTQGLAEIGRRPVLTLRQPSLGPTFGIKGGAAGAGKSQVLPTEIQNLHLTGDFHAVAAAHNLLAAMIDNHLHHGNDLDIDPQSILWPRVLDVNDRVLRDIVVGLGGRPDGVPRQTSFDITAASEVMAILALAAGYDDLRARLGRIVVGSNRSGDPITADHLHAGGAMAVLMRDALMPNLMQTSAGNPVLIHAGPFGNIATGNSSVVADVAASRLGDIVVTESGFGADLGAERMVNVKSRQSGYAPSAAVVVATVRALKAHTGRYRIVPGRALPDELLAENPDDVREGCANLGHHLRTLRQWGVPVVVAINAFPEDHESEHRAIAEYAADAGVACEISTHVIDGGPGAAALARAVVAAVGGNDTPGVVHRDYAAEQPLTEKMEHVARNVYGAEGIDFTPAARQALERYTELGYGDLPVVIAKTHLSIPHDRAIDPEQPWRLPVREVRLAAGAGYVYALSGAISTMPGLSKHPRAERIDLVDGDIVGL